MPPATDIAETLEALRAVFDRLGLRWYLFGAQAAILYGSSRVTQDVDVTVELGRVPLAQLIESLAGAGFVSRTSDVEAHALATRVLPIEHGPSRTPVDLVLAGPGLEELFLAAARKFEVAGVDVTVVAPEDLVTMKLLAGRPQDRADVVAVLRAQRDRLEIARIRTTLEELEAALESDDLVASLDDALRAARR